MKEYKGCKYYTIQDIKQNPHSINSDNPLYYNSLFCFCGENNTPVLVKDVYIDEILYGKYTEEQLEEFNKITIDGYLNTINSR